MIGNSISTYISDHGAKDITIHEKKPADSFMQNLAEIAARNSQRKQPGDRHGSTPERHGNPTVSALQATGFTCKRHT
jgi:hypothetical protein